MGLCFSCCRRFKTDETEPLLARHAPEAPGLLPPRSQIDKLADILAALRSGKLPSQDQINTALRRLLRSDALAIDGSKSARVLGQPQQCGPLSERGKTMLSDVREALEAVIQFGMEKNDDDRVQDLVYQNSCMDTSPINVDYEAAANCKAAGEMENLASAIPSSEELHTDVQHLSRSVLTLSRLLLTSSTFRLLLSDVLLTSRALLADVAADVGRVARTVELRAETVEEAVSPDNEKNGTSVNVKESARPATAELQDVAEETKTEWERLREESPDRIKQVILERLQKTIFQAHQTPAYISALNTLLLLLRKYFERASTAASAMSSMSSGTATVTQMVTVDPHLSLALTDLRIILERLASGRPLSTMISYAEKTLHELIVEPSPPFKSELRQYFEQVGDWLDKGLCDSGFATSAQGRLSAERLYDRGREVMQAEQSGPWVSDARKLLDEVDAFAHALGADRTTRRVVNALEKLSAQSAVLFRAAIGASLDGQRAWREEVKRDVLGWVFPRILKMFKTIPMPRVEMKNGALELAIDAALLSAASTSLVPDHVVVQNWSEMRLETSAAVLGPSGAPVENSVSGGVTSSTRTRVHLDGLRISAHQIGYYVKYTGVLGGLISWEDDGLLSLDVGTQHGYGGLAVDVEIETIPADSEGSPVFTVADVAVNVAGLGLTIDNSRHWIFNKLVLQPLAAPITRRVLQSILASQIRGGLESINEQMSVIRTRAQERARRTQDEEPSWEDYWDALLETARPDENEGDDDDTTGESSPLVKTDTHFTLKGVVQSTVTQPEPNASTPPTPSETVVAVGMGAQILPGKGGPQPNAKPVTEQVRDVLTDMEGAAETAVGKAKTAGNGVVEAAAGVREELEEAEERMEEREDLERQRRGWRSHAFDL